MVLGVNLGGVGAWFSNTGSSLGRILFIFLLIVIVGVIAFFWHQARMRKANYTLTVNLFKIVNGKRFWIASDKAREIVVPGTNVRLLHWLNKNIYSAYPTRSIGLNVYAYSINRVGELTNFDFAEKGDDDTEAKIDYDHRDQTYAYLNLQEFITRNYKSKGAISWWQQNLPLITIIVTTILLCLAMWFFFSQSGKQIAQWSTISANMKDAANMIGNACIQSNNLGSGVVGA
jgi:hypothetical protein